MQGSRRAQRVESGQRVMALLVAGAASMAALQVPAAVGAQPAMSAEVSTALALIAAEPYFADLALAFGATSDAVLERTAALAAARMALARAVAGFGVAAEAAPSLEFERDLADPVDQGAWETDIDLSVTASYRRDAVAVARAGLAVTTAEARLRDQLRDDLQRALLALSNARLADRGLADAVLAAEEAERTLAEAEEAGAPADELLALRVAVELATNAVEREAAASAAADEDEARLGLTTAVPIISTLLTGAERVLGDLAPGAITGLGLRVPSPEQHVGARSLAATLALALAQSNATTFNVLHEFEVYGTYETSGFEVEGRAALTGGVPLVGSTLSWTHGEDDVGFVVGVGATLRLDDQTATRAAEAARVVTAAQSAYASFLGGQVAAELAARRAAELEFEDFALTRLQLMSAQAQLEQARAAGSAQREVQRLVTAHRRAQDAAERAWQRYVRSLIGYLGVADAIWRDAVMEGR